MPVEVGPYSTAGYSNVSLIVPVIPAGSTGVLNFSMTPPAGTPEFTPYALDANLGSPYSTALDGTIDPAVLAGFVSGAQSYAQSNLGVTLTPAELASMSTYASGQLAREFAAGGQALLESAAGDPVFFSDSQLLIDIATYGAGLVNHASANAPVPASSPVSNPCSGSATTAGPNCVPTPTVVPTPITTFTAADCQDLPNHYVSPNGTLCLVASDYPPSAVSGSLRGSVDPNEKDGPLGIGTSHFTLAEDPFGYQIEFENTPTATAPAQTVSVTDPLDKTQYDLSTFQLGPISFGPYVLTPSPGLTSYMGSLDLRPTENVIVAISANLNMGTGVAAWDFTSLDPSTMQLVTNPTAGFLPADINPPAGIGHLSFSVKPLASVASGAAICNTASIVFDTNAALATAPFCNRKDTTAPVSSVSSLSPTEAAPTFTVSWSGSDSGVGVAFYTIYVSVDGGAFSVWQNATASTSASYTGVLGHSYGFYSIATDLLGNTEGAKTKAEATTTVGTVKQAQTITFGTLANRIYGVAPLTLTATASSALPVSYSVTGPAKLSGSTLSITGAGTVSVTAAQEGNANYAPASSVVRNFTVSKAVLTAAANNVSRAYGVANPALTYAVTGYFNGDTSSVISGSATLTTTATSMSPAGTFPITFSTEALTAANYSFTYKPATLTVLAPAIVGTTITLTANPDANLVSGQPITLTAKVTPISGTTVPTGVVTFASPTGGSANVSLDATGKAVYTGIVPAPGTYSVFAQYSGTTNFAKSTSAVISATVSQP